MKKKSLHFIFLIATCTTLFAQSNSLIVNNGIVLPEDSLESKALLLSVNRFLFAAEKNSENKWVLPSERIETQILIDEIQGIQKNEEFENNSFFKAHLTNIIPLEESKYAVKVAYIGIGDNTARLRAHFELIAHKSNDRFLISSPLIYNTQNWKTKKLQNHIFHFPYTLDEERIQLITDRIVFYDKKLKNNTGVTNYYLCKDEINPLNLFGVEYKSDYNGDDLITRYISKENDKALWVVNESGLYDYNIHDLWHNRLGRVISRREVHRRVDCHIATIYGGIWGLSWEELFPIFIEQFPVSKNVDWLEHKKNKSHFLTQDDRKNYTDDFVGALIIRKIEKEKGFDGVWELLLTKRTKEEDEYFDVLERLTGITRKNYNKEAYKLIKEEINNMGI